MRITIGADIGVRHFALCATTTSDTGESTVVHWQLADLGGGGKNQEALVRELREAMDTFCASLPEPPAKLNVERQPHFVKAAGHMIQGALAMYAEASGTHFAFVTARQRGGTYAERKKRSVELARGLVAKDNQWGPWFEKQVKKDDLADALHLSLA
jgi:hypothetical protein